MAAWYKQSNTIVKSLCVASCPRLPLHDSEATPLISLSYVEQHLEGTRNSIAPCKLLIFSTDFERLLISLL